MIVICVFRGEGWGFYFIIKEIYFREIVLLESYSLKGVSGYILVYKLLLWWFESLVEIFFERYNLYSYYFSILGFFI